MAYIPRPEKAIAYCLTSCLFSIEKTTAGEGRICRMMRDAERKGRPPSCRKAARFICQRGGAVRNNTCWWQSRTAKAASLVFL